MIAVITLLAPLGSALIGDVFYAFSSFVMPALARLPAARGAAAMQSINVVVLNRSFLGVFFGTAAACALLALWSLFRLPERGALLRLVGAGLYVVGTIGVTRAFNVPRNDALAAVDADGADAASVWERYVAGWTAWNTVGTAAASAAAAAFTPSL